MNAQQGGRCNKMAGGIYSLTIQDYDGEKTVTKINTGAVTAVSLPALLTQIGNLRTAVDGLIIGVEQKENLMVFSTILDQTLPTSEFAQRETKWVVRYHDNTAFFDAPINAIPNEGYLKPFDIEIGTADLSLLANNDDFLPLTQTEAAAFVTAFEAMARSPYGGVVVVDSIQQVGRNT